MSESTSELQTMLEDMATRLLQDVADLTDTEQWSSIEAFGLTNLLLPESLNGFNGAWQDARIVFELLGRYPLPLPVGETIIAKHFIYQAAPTTDLELLSGIIAIANCDNALLEKDSAGNWLFSGTLSAQPSSAEKLLVEAVVENRHTLLLLNASQAIATIGDIAFKQASVDVVGPATTGQLRLQEAAALLRAAQISGAMQSALELSINYVNERSQFGRPLAKFQVIQHDLARMAEQVAAVKCAVQSACQAADYDAASFEIAAAKLRANMAVPMVCSIAHQVHGAIGFTQEHSLHRFTRRLAAWRSEFGNDRYWSRVLGQLLLDIKQPTIWQFLTARSDAIMENS